MISDLFSLTGVHCQNSDKINRTESLQSENETSMLKSIQEENKRCGGWVRLFPTSDTWEFYSEYLEVRTTFFTIYYYIKNYFQKDGRMEMLKLQIFQEQSQFP